MREILILTENELRQAVSLDMPLIDLIADAFKKLSAGKVSMPPILRMDMEDKNGEVDVKTAYVPGLEGFAIKISPGFFDNPKIGLPTTSGLMVVHDATTGQVRAVLLDNGYLTDMRTAAAGAVAARCLAPAFRPGCKCRPWRWCGLLIRSMSGGAMPIRPKPAPRILNA